MNKEIDTGNKYIKFLLSENKPKTQKWLVINKSSGYSIAVIQWYSSWRQYILEPMATSIYNDGCLETIITFMKRLNKEKQIVF